MYTQRRLVTFFIAVLFSVMAGISQAAEEAIDFKGQKDFKDARGHATITDAGEGQKEIRLDASGLKPDSVYTFWFANQEPKMEMSGVGRPDYSFRSDSQGNASYTAVVPAEDLERWQELDIAYHPEGDPKNLANIEIALSGDLEAMG
ncbi:MAG TPA: hypothetical protein VII64_11980 [Thermodesulfobacteriota bacterium]